MNNVNFIRYKNGIISVNNLPEYNKTIYRVKVDSYAYAMEVKSIQSAKNLITRHENKRKGLK